MRCLELHDANSAEFRLPDEDVLVRSRLREAEHVTAGAALSLKWVLDGEERYAFASREVRLRPGDLLLAPVGAGRQSQVRSRTEVVGRCLYLQPATLQAFAAEDLRGETGVALFPRAGDGLATVLDAIDSGAARPSAGVLARALVASQLARIAERSALPPRKAERRESVHQRLVRVRAHIHEHLDQPLPLATLAGMACMSPFHFARHFRAAFGLPPHAYVLRLRLDVAREQLAAGRSSVGEVAAAVGMPDLQGFSRAFRRAHGVPPSAVLAENRARFA